MASSAGIVTASGIVQPYWAPMMPISLAPAPLPESMPASLVAGFAQGICGDLAVAPMAVPATSAPTAGHWQLGDVQGWSWMAVPDPTASAPQMQNMDVRQRWVGASHEPHMDHVLQSFAAVPAMHQSDMPQQSMLPAQAPQGDIIRHQVALGSNVDLDRPLPQAHTLRGQQQPEAPPAVTAMRSMGGGPEGSAVRQRTSQPKAVCDDSNEVAQARGDADQVLQHLRNGDHNAAVSLFRRLAFSDKASCRAAQHVLEDAPVKDAVVLAGGLRGRVRAAMGSMFANFVLQKVIEVTPSSTASFLAAELSGMGAEVARHPYGCRILCRLLEFASPDEPAVRNLFDEVLTDADNLVRHSFGGYVTQHFLEFGTADHRQRVGQAVSRDLVLNATHKRGSRIVEAALQNCADVERNAIVDGLLASRERALELAQNQFGCHVMKALMKTSDENRKRLSNFMRPVREQMRHSKYGKYVLAASA